MKGVKFGSLHSFYEWGLILSEKEIKSPKPKTIEFEIEGSDGVLDYTDFFGDVKFENRKLSFKFAKPSIVPDGFLALFSVVQNNLHGKKMQVILDDDPDHCYIGRVTVNEWKSNKRIGEIVIDVDAEPYKYKVARSSQLVSLCGSNLINLDKAVISPNGTWTKIDTGYTYQQGASVTGSYAFFEILLAGGKTYTLSVTQAASSTATNLIVYSDRMYGNQIAKGTNIVTFTPEKTGMYIVALVANSSTTAAEFSNVMLVEGSTILPYEAYNNAVEITVTAFVENLKMPSVPDIISQDDVTITNGEETFVIKAGETLHKEEFQMKEGSNQFNITGTGIVVFEWQDGGL